MFFSFDGIDGAGKSTQMELFCDWLTNEKQKEVLQCREPGGTALGEKIRSILLDEQEIRLDLEAELFLFMSSRAQLVREVIRPALEKGVTVVCDRFLMASVVYQGHAGGLDPEMIRSVGAIAIAETQPDLSFVFTLQAEKAQERIGPSTDRIESRSLEFLREVNKGFRIEAERAGENALLIDGEEPIETIFERIKSATSSLIGS